MLQDFIYSQCRPESETISWLATSEESRFQASKGSDMSTAIMQEGLFSDAQKSRFQSAKSTNVGSAVQQWSWIPEAEESRIQA